MELDLLKDSPETGQSSMEDISDALVGDTDNVEEGFDAVTSQPSSSTSNQGLPQQHGIVMNGSTQHSSKGLACICTARIGLGYWALVGQHVLCGCCDNENKTQCYQLLLLSMWYERMVRYVPFSRWQNLNSHAVFWYASLSTFLHSFHTSMCTVERQSGVSLEWYIHRFTGEICMRVIQWSINAAVLFSDQLFATPLPRR